MRKLIGAALIAAASLLPASPASARDSLTIGLSGYPATLHPAFSSEFVASYILGFVRRQITVYDQDWTRICMLCETLPTLENGLARIVELEDGSQGMEVTLTLRDGLVWDDGTPVTTADAQFAVDVGKHADSGVSNKEFFNQLISFEAIDERTMKLTRDRVDYSYNGFSGLDLLPNHLERPIFEADPAGYREKSLYVTAPETPGLWHGPFRITRVDTAAAVIMERNPHWSGPAPAFDTIRIRSFDKSAALDANLLAGEIDYVAGEVGMNLDQVLAFEKRFGDRYDITYLPGLRYAHIDLNLDRPALQDVRVRRALLAAIDRNAISDRLFGGKTSAADSFVHPSDPAHVETQNRTAFDPELAKRLLDEAGWTDIRRGVRHNESGERLSLELRGATESSTVRRIQQVLQSQWKQVGIDVKINNQPARVLFGESLTKRDFGDMAMFSWVSMPEHLPRTILYSDQIPTEENQWVGQNYTGYVNPRVDELIDTIERELSYEKRLPLWAELQEIYATDLPVLPIYHGANGFIMPKWLKGIRPTGHLFPSSLWAEEWSVAE